ncbi:MAG TPA: MBL fold metallo-hydrolase, partial [Armatimonadota bacterium]|nr:MBL fold metallo-hydrolase [Armatimonadota bacterium]
EVTVMRSARYFLLALLLLLAGCSRPSLSRTAGERQDAALGAPARGTLQVAFLDVGQGDSTLVQAPGGTSILIDGGPPEAGPRVIDAIRRAGIKKLDWVLGSHPHSDHIGGLVDVFREIPFERVLDPGYNHGTALQRTYLQLIKEKGAKAILARSGQTYDLGSGAQLQILAPQDPLLKGTDSDPNNNSIVARLVFGGARFLFTGDMEEDERARLLKSHSPAELQAQVLKVAHHGSRNGTDPEFLRVVRPEYAVISCAAHNDYGHPHPEALQALQSAGVPVLRTDQRGTIVFTTDGKQLRLQGSPPVAVNGKAAAAPAAPSAREGRVIGNSASRVYHAPECPALPSPERQVLFSSAAEAEKAGYHHIKPVSNSAVPSPPQER